MNRRKSLGLIAGFSPLLLFPSNHIADKNFDSTEWLKYFKLRWSNSRIYCFEVFDAMPLSNYDYKPHPDSMSFMKLFTHIGSGLNGYATVLDGSPSGNEPEPSISTEVTEYLDNSFTRFNNALEKININDLYEIKHAKSDEEPWKELSIFDMITLGYNHTIHHIGQATVYLRLNDIVPPRYRF